MKVVSIRDCRASLSRFLKTSQGQRVLITCHGKPVSVIVGVEGYDIEDVLTAADPEFWRMIEKRRRDPRTVSLAEARKWFAEKDARRAKRKTTKRAKTERRTKKKVRSR